MNNQEISFIELLQAWRKDNLSWGECCELREYKYLFAAEIEKYYQEWIADLNA